MKTVGLGLDYSNRNEFDFSIEELVNKFEGKLSHLSIVGLESKQDAIDFKNISNEIPVVHHLLGVGPAAKGGVNQNNLEQMRQYSNILRPKWCCEDLGIWYIGDYAIPYFAPPVLCQEIIDQTVTEISKIDLALEEEFLIEIPSVSFLFGDIKLHDFINTISARTGRNMVMDLSHVLSYAAYEGIDPIEAFYLFELEKVVELHIAGGSLHPEHIWRYRDTHNEPVMESVYDLLKEALLSCKNMKAITYEYGVGSTLDLISQEINKITSITEKYNFSPKII
ncbi:DUF692 family protein [Vibrio cholerae]|nr:DUF692 family protein [Vibrio cholerae]EJY4340678.1 DUF692 family protein [Vibrio cholerae]